MLKQTLIGIVMFVCIGAVLYGVWYVTRLPSLTISEVEVVGGETVSHDSLRAIVNHELTGSYLLLVPYTFTYTYPKESIETALSNVPRVHNINVEREGRTALRVTFNEYVPSALLCESGLPTSSCFFMNEEGYVFAPAPALRGNTFVRHVLSETQPETGMQAVSPELLSTVDDFISAIRSEFGFRVSHVLYGASGDDTTEGDITYELSDGGRLLTAREVGIQDTFANLQSVLGSEEFQHIAPGNFNYIDLRFGNRVFVNEELDVVSTTTDATGATGATTSALE